MNHSAEWMIGLVTHDMRFFAFRFLLIEIKKSHRCHLKKPWMNNPAIVDLKKWKVKAKLNYMSELSISCLICMIFYFSIFLQSSLYIYHFDQHYNSGTQRGVVNVQDCSPVVQIKFIDPALHPQDSLEYPPYKKCTAAYILVMCANSALFSVATGSNIPLQVNTISSP